MLQQAPQAVDPLLRHFASHAVSPQGFPHVSSQFLNALVPAGTGSFPIEVPHMQENQQLLSKKSHD
jgi:hypothetical protein